MSAEDLSISMLSALKNILRILREINYHEEWPRAEEGSLPKPFDRRQLSTGTSLEGILPSVTMFGHLEMMNVLKDFHLQKELDDIHRKTKLLLDFADGGSCD